jgi:prepilin peptidase CpaA
MMTTQFFMYGVLVMGLIAAGIMDVRSSRVPNAVTFPLALLGIGFHAISDSGNGLFFSLEGLGLGLVLLLGFYVYGGMGAGDVKLLAAVGAMVGPYNVFMGFLFASLFGGLYAIAMMCWHLGLAHTAERIKVLLVSMVFMKINVAASLEQTPLPKLRYALVIGLGTLAGQGYEWFQAT